MKTIKKIIASLYFYYFNHFPVNRGKNFLARVITKFCGAFILKTKDDIFLEIFLFNQMDTSYFEIKNKMHSIILNLIGSLKKGNVFIDIGANIGYFSILASKFVGDQGKVFSIEPSRREYSRLLKNISINKCNNILPMNIALSNFNGIIPFYIANNHYGLNRMKLDDTDSFTKLYAPCYRFDKILDYYENKIELVKIDVEGAEYLVLEGMNEFLINGVIKTFIIEITDKYLKNYGHNKDMIYDLLVTHGYSYQNKSSDWQYDEIFILNK